MKSLKIFFVYILSNKSRRVYVGFTSELERRTFKHTHKWYPNSFTARYKFDMVVYVERFADPSNGIAREKEIKGWRREKKLRLIRSVNPDWADLSAEWGENELWQAIPEAKPRVYYEGGRLQHRRRKKLVHHRSIIVAAPVLPPV